MKNKILFILNYVWLCLVSFTFPVCSGIIYMYITGHPKGYDYDVGEEADIALFMGCFLLALWIIATVPAGISLFKRLRRMKPIIAVITVALWILLFVLCIYMIGGISEFISFFRP